MPTRAEEIMIENLSSSEIEAIEERMRPGHYSRAGFLNETERLKTVIQRDREALAEMGITPKQIADRLDGIMAQALRLRSMHMYRPEAAQAFTPLIEEKFSVAIMGYLGWQQCPYKTGIDFCGKSSHDLEIYNVENDEDIQFPGLIAHLIRYHHFFEGNSPYRLDPKQAVKTLELKPGVSYESQTAIEYFWTETNALDEIQRAKELINDDAFSLDIADSAVFRFDAKEGLGILTSEVEIALEALPEINGEPVRLYHCKVPKGVRYLKHTASEYVLPWEGGKEPS